jgi:ATP-dependent helicase Lhr and Lhr-like helicase
MRVIGELIIFAGKRWEIISVNPEEKLILLNRAIGGRPPHFDGGGQTIHNRVRQEMFSVYRQNNMPIYLDHNAQEFFKEGIDCFHSMKLNEESIFEYGETAYLFPWLGDKVINTISFLLRLEGIDNASDGGIIEVKKCSKQLLNVGIKRLLEKPKPSVLDLTSIVVDTIIEKNDHFLPIGMRQLNYGTKYFDIDGAWKWLEGAKIWAEKI